MQLIVRLTSLLLLLAACMSASARDYQVEILVFENLDFENVSGERFGVELLDETPGYGDATLARDPNLDADPDEQTDAAPVEIGNFPVVAAAELSLGSVHEKLLASRDYAPILITGWVLPGMPQTESQAAAIAGSRGSRVVNGTARFSVDSFLRLRLELEFGVAGETLELKRTQTRIRSRQLYYFDHPRFGVLAMVTPK